jgi:hypothetical protein
MQLQAVLDDLCSRFILNNPYDGEHLFLSSVRELCAEHDCSVAIFFFTCFFFLLGFFFFVFFFFFFFFFFFK